MITPPENPLLAMMAQTQEPGRSGAVVDCSKLKTPHCFHGKSPADSREIRKFMRTETARQAIGTLYPGCAIFGVTKGQFSLIETIEAILEQIGPAHLFVSTWTAHGTDLSDAFKLLESGKLLSTRWLVDHTFQRRKPAFAAKIRQLFGDDSIRVTRNHAKFCLFRNQAWNLTLLTSMNLNFNPRLENFAIEDNPALADFLQGLVDEIFRRRKKTDIADAPAVNEQRFLKL